MLCYNLRGRDHYTDIIKKEHNYTHNDQQILHHNLCYKYADSHSTGLTYSLIFMKNEGSLLHPPLSATGFFSFRWKQSTHTIHIVTPNIVRSSFTFTPSSQLHKGFLWIYCYNFLLIFHFSHTGQTVGWVAQGSIPGMVKGLFSRTLRLSYQG